MSPERSVTDARRASSVGDGLAGFYERPEAVLASGLERAQHQLRMLTTTVQAYQCPPRIVDIGCGDGAATAIAAALDGVGRVIGVDWATRALREAKQRGLVTARAGIDGSGLPLRSGSVDVVMMSEVIEHLVATDEALAEVRRVLRPGGTLLLSTPNLAAWFNRILLLAGVQPVFSEVSMRGIYGRPGSEVVGHLRLFTRRALTEFLTASGFCVEEMRGAPYHDVPRSLRGLDRLACRRPDLASILLARARRVE